MIRARNQIGLERFSYFAALLVFLSFSCDNGDDDGGASPESEVYSDVTVGFDLAGGMFDAPFPNPTRVNDKGGVDFDGLPNPDNHAVLNGYIEAARVSGSGISRSGAVYFPFDGRLDTSEFEGELIDGTDQPIFLINIDPGSPERGKTFPITTKFYSQAEKFIPRFILAILPLPGFVAREDTLYAAVVMRSIRDADGRRLRRAPAVASLLAGENVPGGESLAEGFAALGETLGEKGVKKSEVAAATVWRTGASNADMTKIIEALADYNADPKIVKRIRDYPSYCALEGEVMLPIFQKGERTYNDVGAGAINFVEGAPEPVWFESVRFALTIPKKTMPSGGFPILFYVNGSGGKYTQVIDRGTFAEQSTPRNGRGPALYAADVGIAAMAIEAPMTGPRHPSGSFDNIDFFNIFNLIAFRDNIRQGAIDYFVLPRAAAKMQITISDYCSGVTAAGDEIRFDSDKFFLHGHSTGSSIGALVLGSDPIYSAGVMSGSGGSWIYNLVMKEHPLKMAEVVETVLGFPSGEKLDQFSPIATLFQTAIEAAEAMNFAPNWVDRPPAGADAKNVLMIEGVIDGYFLPRMSNALAMAARLDLAGPTVEPTAEQELALVGSTTAVLPASANRGGVSAFVTQFAAPDFDGHYVLFQLDEAKYSYKCWFAGVAKNGVATLVDRVADGLAPCP